jgi:phosphohistidine phosphatase SixA
MNAKKCFNFMLLSMGVFLWGCTPASNNGSPDNEGDLLLVFLVRHAEKVDHSKDADLSGDGYLRAGELARTLADAGIEYIHSSDFIRTKETAKPVAELFGLEVELYDPRDLDTLADQLKASGGRHLVVGHSTTTPAMVELLGGDPGSAIEEENEYDRLYILSIVKGEVKTVLLRYGKPCSSLPSKISASSLEVPQISGSALKSSHTLGLPG